MYAPRKSFKKQLIWFQKLFGRIELESRLDSLSSGSRLSVFAMTNKSNKEWPKEINLPRPVQTNLVPTPHLQVKP